MNTLRGPHRHPTEPVPNVADAESRLAPTNRILRHLSSLEYVLALLQEALVLPPVVQVDQDKVDRKQRHKDQQKASRHHADDDPFVDVVGADDGGDVEAPVHGVVVVEDDAVVCLVVVLDENAGRLAVGVVGVDAVDGVVPELQLAALSVLGGHQINSFFNVSTGGVYHVLHMALLISNLFRREGLCGRGGGGWHRYVKLLYVPYFWGRVGGG